MIVKKTTDGDSEGIGKVIFTERRGNNMYIIVLEDHRLTNNRMSMVH